MESKGWVNDINVHTLLARWALLVGPVNAGHSKPEAYEDSVLTVRTDSSAWATQFRLMAPKLVAMLNDQLGVGTITKMRSSVRTAPPGRRVGCPSATAAARATPTAERKVSGFRSGN